MISRKHFAAQIKRLSDIFPDSTISDKQAMLYYEVMSPDFTNEQFDVALNMALKNSFKFPPIAAFYKKDPGAPEPLKVYDPLTKEETAAIRRTLDQYGL
jgi:acetone carboxylase gamma subunit